MDIILPTSHLMPRLKAIDKNIFLFMGSIPFVKAVQNFLRDCILNCAGHAWVEKRQEELMTEFMILLRTLAHEIKHPLGVIVNSAELLQEHRYTMSLDEQERWLQQIMQQGLELDKIINELILLSTINETKVETGSLDMTQIVDNAQQHLADMIANYQASVIYPETWPLAIGYAPWVERVWVNYLNNALKYGEQPVRIRLGATRQIDGMVRFWIQDNGPGLTPEDQAQLFKPFTKLDRSQSDGHGLGLSIVKYIVVKLGGQVGVESQGIPGQGSVFYFTLPGYNG